MTAPTVTAEAPTRVPFVRLDNGDQALMDELMATVADVAARSAFTLGAPVEQFEREFADWCGSKFSVGVSSGTAALELALRALAIGPGDKVIVPTNSFIATAEAVSAVGATPRLVDVDEETSLLTAEIVAAALTPDTKCVIPVHLYGRTVEMGPLAELCESRGLYLIEDACQAHGSVYEGKRAGSIGHVGCFSFYPTKNLGAWGDGGALVTDDERIAERVRLLRSHGEGARHHHEMPARTDRLDGLQAAILSVKLGHLDEANQRRRKAGAALTEALAGSSVLTPAGVPAGSDHVFHLYVVRSEARDE
ncbi:MAG TPA: DegT/DnrJ/EryC1/StrS family aminotransferase, partial [Solirubrobacterales bacterium]|nr:DegT/DnrJ/EryC1/StrS family aminotransferase [Solirubrobacterales bacterium]